LAFYGIVIEEEKIQTYWSKNYIKWIDENTKHLDTATIALEALIKELKDRKTIILELTKQIRQLSKKERYRDDIDLLISIPGISILSAITILTEIGSIKNFNKLDRLNGFIGLIPGEHSSGERESKGRMIHRGNKLLKKILVECSWIAVRKDPSLILSYKEYIKRHKKTKAIIKIARKLVNRIMFVLKNRQKYELSIA
jgi:transposase